MADPPEPDPTPCRDVVARVLAEANARAHVALRRQRSRRYAAALGDLAEAIQAYERARRAVLAVHAAGVVAGDVHPVPAVPSAAQAGPAVAAVLSILLSPAGCRLRPAKRPPSVSRHSPPARRDTTAANITRG